MPWKFTHVDLTRPIYYIPDIPLYGQCPQERVILTVGHNQNQYQSDTVTQPFKLTDSQFYFSSINQSKAIICSFAVAVAVAVGSIVSSSPQSGN